jgi:ABC-type Na+ efflux pump permease subunit
MNIRKTWLVASREFVVTLSSRGFVVGLLLMPAVIVLLFVALPRLMNARTPEVRGELAVVDSTTQVIAEIERALNPVAVADRRAADARRALSAAAGESPALGEEVIERAVGQVPDIRIVDAGATIEPTAISEWLITSPAGIRRLALVVIDDDAIVRERDQSDLRTYTLYVSSSLEERTENAIHEGVQRGIVYSARLGAIGLKHEALETMMRVARPSPIVVSRDGQRETRRGFNRGLPFFMGGLLFAAVMIGGQTLMTSTVEEKSSRVVEVLLAAVSPFELMAGKLLGQLALSLLVLSLYIGLGLLGLFSFAMLGLLDPSLVLYLLVFFLITYLIFGAVMTAIGAAVNEMAEAQSLFGPVLMLLMSPWLLLPAIQRAPDSTFSVALSFVPPVNSLVMMTRLAVLNTPPPMWQIALTIAIGIGAAVAAVWFAAKVFKAGLLMHGKPPTLATMIRWARDA